MLQLQPRRFETPSENRSKGKLLIIASSDIDSCVEGGEGKNEKLIYTSHFYSIYNKVLGRVMLLTIVCAAVFFLRIMYSLLVVAGVVQTKDTGYPFDSEGNLVMGEYYFDCIWFLIQEWIPCFVILIAMRRKGPIIAKGNQVAARKDSLASLSRPLLDDIDKNGNGKDIMDSYVAIPSAAHIANSKGAGNGSGTGSAVGGAAAVRR